MVYIHWILVNFDSANQLIVSPCVEIGGCVQPCATINPWPLVTADNIRDDIARFLPVSHALTYI